MDVFAKVFRIGVLIAGLAAPVSADPLADKVWDLDSIAPMGAAPTSAQITAQEVYAVVSHQIDAWNAHDIEAYLETFEKSASMVAVEDGAVIVGWQDFHDKWVRAFHDSNVMGHAALSRVQIKMTSADTAFVLAHYTVSFGQSPHVVVGVDTSTMRRSNGVWHIIYGHTTSIEM
jgi:uncharacterized protein (TIGR02246 family)